MGTPVVTQDAVTSAGAAAATESTPARHADFLPTDEHYRLTGELPEADTSTKGEGEQPGAGDEDAPTDGTEKDGDDNAAASREAASSQKTQEETKTTAATPAENRYAKITRENRELRERLARLEGREEGRSASREIKQTSQPAAEQAKPEPQIDDVDPKSGKAKFATLQDYLNARDEWREEKTLAKVRAENAKTAEQRAQSEGERIIEEEVSKRVTASKKAHPDYDATMTGAAQQKDKFGQDAFFYTKGSHIDGFFLESEIGHEVMYQIAKNFDQHKGIFARDQNGKYLMNPIRQLRELAKIEVELAGKSSKSSSSAAAGDAGAGAGSGRAVSQAPRPPHQTSGQGTVTKDAIEEAVEKGDTETYMREQNARDLARLKRGK